MIEQAIIDMQTYMQLREQMGADFIIELIDTYNTETAALIEQLNQALASGEVALFGRSAHSIKSSSASLGALLFSQQARELEMMGKANNLLGADKKLAQLSADFILVRQRLEELKNEP
jgi:HPt (histidine-containing phosphotransfer) domain-containing protein